METVRIGIIGAGGMGRHHSRTLLSGKLDNMELRAICDVDEARLAQFPDQIGFTDSGVPLIAPASEGIRSVELTNAMLFSSLNEVTVELPLDGAEFEALLQRLVRESTARKVANESA